AFQCSVEFQAEIIVEAAGGMLLDNEAQRTVACRHRSLRFGVLREISLGGVIVELPGHDGFLPAYEAWRRFSAPATLDLAPARLGAFVAGARVPFAPCKLRLSNSVRSITLLGADVSGAGSGASTTWVLPALIFRLTSARKSSRKLSRYRSRSSRSLMSPISFTAIDSSFSLSPTPFAPVVARARSFMSHNVLAQRS